MANSTIPNLVAVTVPAGTDLLGVRQSGDTRDKKLTVTQLLSLAPAGGDVFKVGTPANDQLPVWTGDGTIEGNANFNVVGIELRSALGNGPSIRNISSTSGTVPSLVPRQGDSNTGVSNAGDDRIALTAGGVMAVRAIESGAAISSIDLFGPTVVTGFIRVTDAAGPQIQNEAASATNPTLLPNRADIDSGIGQNAADQLSLIAGGVELLRISDDAGAFILAGTNAAADGGDLDLSSGDSGVAATGDGGAVNILSGESLATTGDGGAITIKSGAGFFQGSGGDILVEVGSGGSASPGTSGNFFVNTLTGIGADGGLSVPIPGLVSIYGIGRSGEGVAGDLDLWAGYAAGTGGGSIGGDLNLFGGGQGGGAGAGGNAHLYGGESDTQPGDAEIEGGVATVGGIGGKAFVRGGAGFGTNFAGGFATVQGGLGIGTGNGGAANLRGGDSGSGLTGIGGAINITGGLSAATNGDGGAINLNSGSGAGSGDNGDISLSVGGSAIVFDAVTDRLIQGAEIFAYQSEAVSKVGTPVNNQVGVWTGDGTLEGDVDLTFDGTILTTGLTGRVRTGVGTTSQAAFGFATEINTGIYRQGAGSLGVTLQGSGNWLFQAGSFFANIVDGPRMMFEAASATNPVFVPRLGDQDSGIGSGAADQVDLIAGGLSCMAVRETAAARQIGFYTTAPISQQTGVAVTDVAIHAALVALGLITA